MCCKNQRRKVIREVTLTLLKPGDLPAVLALQEKVYRHLCDLGRPRFIVPRTTEYFEAHLEDPHTMIGFFEDGHHIAQAIFRVAVRPDIPVELEIPALPGHDGEERISVLQGVLVDPDCRGRGIMNQIITSWQTWCAGQGISHLCARTEASHDASKGRFTNAGFTMVAQTVDRRDNASICVFHRILD